MDGAKKRYPHKTDRDYRLDKDKAYFNLDGVLMPAGTLIPERVCGDCAHYIYGGWCAEKRREIGFLWEACNKWKDKHEEQTPRKETMEKTTPTTKVCKRCGRELPLEAFGKTVRSKDGYQSNCRECQAELVRQGWEKRRAEGKAHPAPMRKKAPKETTVAANPALAELPDHDLVQELRRRGYDVKCTKTIEL